MKYAHSIMIGLLAAVLSGPVSSVALTVTDSNTEPTIPILIRPIGQVIIENQAPVLWFHNSYDADGDLLTYDILATPDSAVGDAFYETAFDYPQGADSTAYQLQQSVDDNSSVWWRVRACDDQSVSDWSDPQVFWIDANPEHPTAPRCEFPNDSSGFPQFEMLPVFTFRHSLDPDPFDTLRYRIEIATDTSFALATIYDSLSDDGILIDFLLSDSLAFGTEYFWRVVAIDRTGLTSISNVRHFWTWLPGDLDHSHQINIADLVFLVSYMFAGGPPAEPSFVMDLNGDCTAPDIADLIHLFQYMFIGGAPPVAGCLNRTGLL